MTPRETRDKEASRRVLVVDDEADIRELLDMTLARMGLAADCAGSLTEARQLLEQGNYKLCLTDMRLQDGEGLDLVRLIADRHPHLPVAVITAHGSLENAVCALKAGAFDYLSKPVSLDQLRALVRSAVDLPPGGEMTSMSPTKVLLGDSAALSQARSLIDRVARSQAPIYVTGESGCGKELAARLIHEKGTRAGKPFVAVNCGAIPEALVESEFFGYRKGAFTGADTERDGFFQAANG
ncbi:partial DNA-binding transcriptional regulator NtrC, partial [Rhodocyclaceae bacterium]